MAQPEFPLEVLRRHRRRQEEERQIELAAAQARHADELAALEALGVAWEHALSELRSTQEKPTLDVEEIVRALAYAGSLKAEIARQEQVVLDLARECEAARARLLEAARAVKVVERLRELWLAERQRELLQREERVAAEAAIGQFNRRASVV